MRELIRTNDMILINFIQSLLKGSEIGCFVFDMHTSVLEGSIGIIPRRVMVLEDDLTDAQMLLREAGISYDI